jgi:hypothetical protein
MPSYGTAKGNIDGRSLLSEHKGTVTVGTEREMQRRRRGDLGRQAASAKTKEQAW